MSIKAPHWAPAGTHPTSKGWATPTGEVVKKAEVYCGTNRRVAFGSSRTDIARSTSRRISGNT